MTHEAISNFWEWFKQFEHSVTDEIFTSLQFFDQIYKELTPRLTALHSDLSFEIGPSDTSEFSLIISGSGLPEMIPVVKRIVECAPALDRWDFIAFKPPRPIENSSIQLEDIEIELEDISFVLEPELRRISVTFYCEQIDEISPEFCSELSFTLLDIVLGEYEVMKSVGYVALLSSDEIDTDDDPLPLTELPTHFKKMASEVSQSYNSFLKQSKNEQVDEILGWVLDKELSPPASSGSNDPIRLFASLYAPDTAAVESLKKEATNWFLVAVDSLSLIGEHVEIEGRIELSRATLKRSEQFLRKFAHTALTHGCVLEAIAVEDPSDYEEGMLSMSSTLFLGLISLEQYTEAIALFRRSPEIKYENEEILSLAGYALARTGDSEAEELIDSALEELLIPTESMGSLWTICCSYALSGNKEKALQCLKTLIEHEESLKELALTDPDLLSIRKEPEFEALIGIL